VIEKFDHLRPQLPVDPDTSTRSESHEPITAGADNATMGVMGLAGSRTAYCVTGTDFQDAQLETVDVHSAFKVPVAFKDILSPTSILFESEIKGVT